MRASSSRQGICSLLPDTYCLLRVVTALCCESDALSQARPGQEPGVSLLLAVVRTTNEPPRQPKIPSTAEASARCSPVRVGLALTLVPALLSHLALPVLRKEHPAGTHCCKAYAGSRAREPMYGRRIVQWTRRLPCAACMHAAACVRACVRGSADIRFEKLRRLIARRPAS